jgi:hypothetical protein
LSFSKATNSGTEVGTAKPNAYLVMFAAKLVGRQKYGCPCNHGGFVSLDRHIAHYRVLESVLGIGLLQLALSITLALLGHAKCGV